MPPGSSIAQAGEYMDVFFFCVIHIKETKRHISVLGFNNNLFVLIPLSMLPKLSFRRSSALTSLMYSMFCIVLRTKLVQMLQHVLDRNAVQRFVALFSKYSIFNAV